MQSVKIDIKRAGVYSEVRKTSAYIGSKIPTEDGGTLYDNVAAVSENEEMLERFLVEAYDNVAEVSKDYISSLTKGDTNLTLTYAMPNGYNVAFNAVLQGKIYSYMVNYVLAMWLMQCNYPKDVAAVYKQDCVAILASIKDILTARSNERAASGNTSVGGNDIGIGEAPDFGTDDTDGTESVGGNDIGNSMRQNIGKANIIRVSMT